MRLFIRTVDGLKQNHFKELLLLQDVDGKVIYGMKLPDKGECKLYKFWSENNGV